MTLTQKIFRVVVHWTLTIGSGRGSGHYTRGKAEFSRSALKDCDKDVFPNIHALLRIACTLPVTSAENERSNSVLKRLKTYLRSTMGSDSLSPLALMHIHRSAFVDFRKIVSRFAELHLRRMLLFSQLFDDN